MSVSTNETDQTKINRAIQQLEQGRLNVTGTVTLTPNTGITVVKAANCGAASKVFLTPATLDAAAALASTYITSVANGSFTISHLTNAQSDRIFGYACLG